MSVEVPEGVNLICYADDLAVSVTADSAADLMRKGDETLHNIMLWMTHNRLEIAPQKTVAIIFNRRLRAENSFRCGSIQVTPAPSVTYLGVTLDCNLEFWQTRKDSL
ncbi:jg12796 [Pararge aegeria aegeria]|uniref:Jg12796 protein n=1 Tax=Pararge aegeria aegeria TaxID=348720 RepID=A0A8S4RI96_9NEOP|nr:jg12796 [Pararge aegeria aegeria]